MDISERNGIIMIKLVCRQIRKSLSLVGEYKYKYFFKLNMISILYGLMFFFPFVLMANVYRMSRLTNWDINTINILIGITILIIFIGCTFLLFFLTKRWLNGHKTKFFIVLLWLPYLVLFSYINAALFPITHPGDKPNPVTGLILLGGLILYPIYILGLNFISSPDIEETMKTI